MNIKKILNLYINLNTESYKEDIKHYNMQNLIINFWNGKITLWKSYWIVGELINAFLILLILTVEIKYFNNALIANQIPFFVGQAMKLSKGKANPKILNDLLLEKLY